ncbi:MAG: hypothetical protein KC422_12075 [Trueperaceae bacterium]|nr:hypothetical protein [Trueperaceae bacterium]
MIRSLAPDELPWFLSQAYRFSGHSDPTGFALRSIKHLRDAEIEADHCFVLIENREAVAGVYVVGPNKGEDDLNLYLANPWYTHDEAELERLLRQVFARFHYEAVHFPLYYLAKEHITLFEAPFRRLGFFLEDTCDLRFELSDLPPLGIPILLEAWTYIADDLFAETFTQAEQAPVSEEYWAWLKRWRGPFQPDFWFLGRETLDQDPIGYGFFGAHKLGIDGIYYLTAIGTLAEHRHSSEMLRRLVLSCMHELASQSPLGRIETSLSMKDPKLVQIFASLGFEIANRYPKFIKRPS